MNKQSEFYQDKNLENKYNELCVNCSYDCKQSFKSNIISCRLLKEQKGMKKNGTRWNKK